MFLVRSKLPNETLALWEQSLKNHREIIKWSQLEEFLVDRYEAVDIISSMRTIKERMSLPSNAKPKILSYAYQETLNIECKVCDGDHNLRLCPNFKKFTVQQRIDFILANKFCNSCLSPSHLKVKCPSKHTCYICKMDHHTLLHLPKPIASKAQANFSQPQKVQSDNSQPFKNDSRKCNDILPVLPSTSSQALQNQVQANVSINS